MTENVAVSIHTCKKVLILTDATDRYKPLVTIASHMCTVMVYEVK